MHRHLAAHTQADHDGQVQGYRAWRAANPEDPALRAYEALVQECAGDMEGVHSRERERQLREMTAAMARVLGLLEGRG